MLTDAIHLDRIKRSILSVGLNKGRGFVVKNDYGDPCIITAAHCLPEIPQCYCRSPEDAPYYSDLIGPLGEKPTIGAQVGFVDPIADIAVLIDGCGKDYYALVEHPLPISLPPKEENRAWVMSLTGEWIELKVRLVDVGLWVAKAGEKFAGGMSGSPIVGLDGAAIGVVSGHTTQLMSLASDHSGEVWAPVDTPQPCIAYCLPPRLAISAKPTGGL
jgi:hypothetical protein